jgi:hypothetical protein
MVDTVSINITGDSAEFQAAAARAEAALGSLQQKVQGTTDGLAPMDAATRELLETWDSGAASLRKGSDAFAAVTEAMQANQLSGTQAARLMDNIAQSAEKSGQSAHAGAAGISFYTNELRALGDEAASGRWRQFDGSFLRLMTHMAAANPEIAAVVAGVALLSATFGGAIISAESFDRAIGSIGTALDAAGRGADGNRESIGSIIDTLRLLPGVSTSTAEQMVSDFARQRDIGVGSYADLGTAAAGFARVTGTQVPAAAEQLVRALNDGYSGIQKLDQAYDFLSPAQLQQIQQFEQAGQQGQALSIAIDALTAKFGPLAAEGLTPIQKSSLQLKDSWDGLMQSMGNSAPINAARAGLAGLLDSMRDVIDQKGPVGVEWAGIVGDEDEGSAPGAAPSAPAAPGVQGAPNGETDPNAQIKEALTLTQQLGTESARREEIENHIAQLQRAAALAGTQAQQARDNGNGAAAGAYEAQQSQLVSAQADLQQQLDALNTKGTTDRVRDWEAALQNQLMASGQFGQGAIQTEIDYWTKRRDEADKGSADYDEITQKLYSLESEAAKKGSSDVIQTWTAQIDQQLSTQRLFGSQATAAELQFWEQKKAAAQAGTAEYNEIVTKVYDLQKQQDEQRATEARQSASELADITTTMNSVTASAARPAEKAPRGKSNILAIFGLDDASEQVAQAMQEAKATYDQQRASLQAEFAQAGGKGQLGDLVGQAQGGASPQQIQSSIAGMGGNSADITHVFDQALKAQQTFTTQSQALGQQSSQAWQKDWETALAPINQAFDRSIQGIIQGTTSLSSAMANMANSITLSFIEKSEQMAVKWAADQLAQLTSTATTEVGKTTAVTAGTTARTTVTAAGATASKAAQGAADSSSILSSAYTAAAGAYASASAIPYVGWILGPIAGAAAFAAVAAFDVVSAAGGMESVPVDDMPALLHRNEMVLPASIASPLRSAIGTWGAPGAANSNLAGSFQGGGANASSTVNLHYAPSIAGSNGPMSRPDAEAFFRNHGDLMVKHLRNAYRNGSLGK